MQTFDDLRAVSVKADFVVAESLHKTPSEPR